MAQNISVAPRSSHISSAPAWFLYGPHHLYGQRYMHYISFCLTLLFDDTRMTENQDWKGRLEIIQYNPQMRQAQLEQVVHDLV